MVWRVHHGTFGPTLGCQIRAFSLMGPHSGTNFQNLAKITPGTIRIILIPCTKNTHFGHEKAFFVGICVNFFWNFEYQLTSKALCAWLDLRWACVKFWTQDGLVYSVLDLTWALWHQDLRWAHVKFWALDGLVYTILDLTWTLWHLDLRWACVESGSPDGLVYIVVDLTWALWHLDLWWACVKFWAPDGLVYAVLDLTWALWHWTCRGPTKETILLSKNSGPMMVIQNWPPPNWTKLCHNVDFYLYFH